MPQTYLWKPNCPASEVFTRLKKLCEKTDDSRKDPDALRLSVKRNTSCKMFTIHTRRQFIGWPRLSWERPHLRCELEDTDGSCCLTARVKAPRLLNVLLLLIMTVMIVVCIIMMIRERELLWLAPISVWIILMGILMAFRHRAGTTIPLIVNRIDETIGEHSLMWE